MYSRYIYICISLSTYFLSIYIYIYYMCVYVCTYVHVAVLGSSLRDLGSSSHVVEASRDHPICLDDGYLSPDETG